MATSDLFDFNPDHSDAVRRACALIGDKAPAWLQREIQVGIQLLDLQDHQYLWLARTGSYAAGNNTPTNAARGSCGVLTNPAGSKKIVRVRRMILSGAGAALSIFWNVIGPASAAIPALLDTTTPVIAPRDSRISAQLAGTPSAAATLRLGTTAGTVATGEFLQIPAAAAVEQVRLDITLAPGGMLWVFGITANVGFNLSLAWDERDALETELN